MGAAILGHVAFLPSLAFGPSHSDSCRCAGALLQGVVLALDADNELVDGTKTLFACI